MSSGGGISPPQTKGRLNDMTIKEKLKLMEEIEKRNNERLVKAGLKKGADNNG